MTPSRETRTRRSPLRLALRARLRDDRRVLRSAGQSVNINTNNNPTRSEATSSHRAGASASHRFHTRRQLSCWKCRPAVEPEPVWLEMTADQGRVTVTEAEPFTGAGEPPTRVESYVDQAVVLLGEQGPMNAGALCEALAGNAVDSTAKRALTRAVADERLIKIDRGRYTIPHLGQPDPSDPTTDPNLVQSGQTPRGGDLTEPTTDDQLAVPASSNGHHADADAELERLAAKWGQA